MPCRSPSAFTLLVLCTYLFVCVVSSAEPSEQPAVPRYLDAAAPIPARVQDLLAKMTIEEKIAQLWANQLAPAQLMKQLGVSQGLGSASIMSMSRGPLNVTAAVEMRNSVQRTFMNGSRLSIPVSFHTEALHGGAHGGTIFPMPVTTAASWNTSLAGAIGSAIAEQVRAVGGDVAYAPVVNMWTDPRFGRLQEGFSENPVISSHLGVAYTVGLQGGNTDGADAYLPSNGVVALAKHYAAYGAAAGGLNAAPADISNRSASGLQARAALVPDWLTPVVSAARCVPAAVGRYGGAARRLARRDARPQHDCSRPLPWKPVADQ